MKKLAILFLGLCTATLHCAAQDDVYFVSSKKKAKTQKTPGKSVVLPRGLERKRGALQLGAGILRAVRRRKI